MVSEKRKKIPAFEKALKPFLEEVAKENGIIEFKVMKKIEDPSWYLFYEVYEDMEALETHCRTRHVDDFAVTLFDTTEEGLVRGLWEEFASIQQVLSGSSLPDNAVI